MRGFLIGIYGYLQVSILWMDKPVGASLWFVLKKAFEIKDSSMPTRKRKGVAGISLSRNCWKELLLSAFWLPSPFRGFWWDLFRFVCDFVRFFWGLLRFYWDLSGGWPIFWIWVGFLGFMGGFCWAPIGLNCLGLLRFGPFLGLWWDLFRLLWGLFSI